MWKYIIYISGLLIILSACTHKDLCYEHPHYNHVKVVINWEETRVAPVMEMRTNFILTEGNFKIGRNDMGMYGGYIEAMPGNSYKAMCYDYMNSKNVYFANEEDELFKAYTIDGLRNSYSELFPTEHLVLEPDQLYLDKIDNVAIEEMPNGGEQIINFYPTQRLIKYTYEIRKVRGASYLNSIGMACSGVSKSYSIITEHPSEDDATII